MKWRDNVEGGEGGWGKMVKKGRRKRWKITRIVRRKEEVNKKMKKNK